MASTRRQIIGGIAGILATGTAPAAIIRSALGARGIVFARNDDRPDWGGCTVLEVSIPSGGFDFVIYTVSPPSVEIDWGDGTVDTLRHHLYAEGKYTIKIGKECNRYYLAWGSSPSQKYLTAVRNIGVNLTSFNYQQMAFNSSLPILETFETVDVPPLTTIERMLSSSTSLRSVSLPSGFGASATNVSKALVSWGMIEGIDIVVPAGFGSVATTTNGCFARAYCRSITFPSGFGAVATDVTSTVNTDTSNLLQKVSFPEGFGAMAEAGKCKFIATANESWSNTTLTDLQMHGDGTGIRFSFSLNKFRSISVPSVVSVMRSLQPISSGMGRQTLTLYDGKRQEYESSPSFVAEAIDLNAKGWDIVYA